MKMDFLWGESIKNKIKFQKENLFFHRLQVLFVPKRLISHRLRQTLSLKILINIQDMFHDKEDLFGSDGK